MSKALKIDFIGAGNLAWNLAPALENAGASVRNIYSRNPENAKRLASKLYEGQVKTDLDFSQNEVDIILIAVADDAIEEVVKEIILPDNVIIAHTSGAVPLSTLGYLAALNIGVFYPLQTFTKKQRVNFSEIPILIEGENTDTINALIKLAEKVSSNVYNISSNQRQQLHLAAVFANNFTNWMLTQSQAILKKSDLDLSLLQPLLEQSIAKAIELEPQNAQTGPAKRGDFEVLDAQMKLLAHQPERQELYRLITQQIVNYYQPQSDE